MVKSLPKTDLQRIFLKFEIRGSTSEKLVLVITCLGGLFGGDKLSKWIFENFETARVKQGQFRNFQKSRG